MAIIETRPARSARLASDRTGVFSRTDRAEWRFVLTVIALVLVITSLPYLFGFLTAPDDKQFVGVMLGVADHAQYFAWMRDLATHNLAADRMTPEFNEPAFFNLLWWSLGHVGAWTGLNYVGLYTLLRVFAVVVCLGSAYAFFRLVIPLDRERRLAFVLFAFSAGLGIIWVVLKYVLGQSDAMFPLDTHTAEANTFLIMLGFPHFTLALGLLIATFALILLGLRERRHRYSLAAGAVALSLGLQHTYDLVTIYAVLGLFGLLLWSRDRKFPSFFFVTGVIVIGLSAPPAAYSVWLVKSNPVWGEVLAQFDGAGVFTPNPLHLPILLGIPFLLALIAFRPHMLRSRRDAELFVAVWFIAHFALVYLPLDFQIHLLLGWQVPIAVLAASALSTYVAPVISGRLRMKPALVIGAIIAAAVLTNIYITSWRFVELERYQEPYFLSSGEVSALAWLEDHTTAEDVVLSDEDFGQFVPVHTDARAFLGHWANTLDFEGKRAMAATVLDPETGSRDRRHILTDYDVTYVVARGDERPAPPGESVPSTTLTPVAEWDGVRLYRVEPSAGWSRLQALRTSLSAIRSYAWSATR